MTELSNWLLIGLAVAGLALAVPLVGAHGDGVLGPADPGPNGGQAHHGGPAGGGHAGSGHHAGGADHHAGGVDYHTNGADHHVSGVDHHADGLQLGAGNVTAQHAHTHDSIVVEDSESQPRVDEVPQDGTRDIHPHGGVARVNTTDSAPSAGYHAGHGCGH